MSHSNENSDYEVFVKAFVEAYPELSRKVAWKQAKAMWTKVKPIKGDREKLNKKLSELKQTAQRLKLKKMSFWMNLKGRSESAQNATNQVHVDESLEMKTESESAEKMEETESSKVTSEETEPTKVVSEETNDDSEKTDFLLERKVRETPVQTKLKDEIGKIKTQLLKLRSIENSGISALNCRDEILKFNKILMVKERKLARLSDQARYMKKFRLKNKDAIKRLIKERFDFITFGFIGGNTF